MGKKGKSKRKKGAIQKQTNEAKPSKARTRFEKFLRKRNWTKKRQMDLQVGRSVGW